MARTVVPVTTLGFVKAAYTTALAGTHNDLVYTAVDGGTGGNEITITYVVSGANTALACTVNGKAIVVTVATDGGSAATSTATEVKNKVDANSDAARLVTVALNTGNDGTGIVAALGATNLTVGTLGVAQPSQTNSDATNDMYFTGNDGNIQVEVYNANAGTQTVSFYLAPGVAAGQALNSALQTESLTTLQTKVLGPFAPALFNQNSSGDVYFDPSVNTDLKFRIYKSVRAR